MSELYVKEAWTDEEAAILSRHFSNLDRPVFVLMNLPQVTMGALFARYSRTHKSLRRLFLDEFVGKADVAEPIGNEDAVGAERAERLYESVFVDYGDDSVAQLGGVHLACEQASNVLTKILEWGRLMAYLEQSTRYIDYSAPLPNGQFRYYRDPEILASPLGERYLRDMDHMFREYGEMVPLMVEYFREHFPQTEGTSDAVYRNALRAKAFDALRGLLPAAALSNLGIYGSGQSYEHLIMRMQQHPLPEARAYAQMMLEELRKVIPAFLTRVDLPDRGVEWSEYWEANRQRMAEVVDLYLGGLEPDVTTEVTLVDFDPDGEDKLVAAALYAYSDLPERQIMEAVRKMSPEEKADILTAYAGERSNRRHKPGRGMERISYRFDILSNYGAFRDLQRHRMLTIDWQDLSPTHGYEIPMAVREAGLADRYEAVLAVSAELYQALVDVFSIKQAAYAVSLAYKLRYVLQFNAREAFHMLELRTGPQAHPDYKRICQEMARQIKEEAGHSVLAALLTFLGGSEGETLERLQAETRAEAKRKAAGRA